MSAILRLTGSVGIVSVLTSALFAGSISELSQVDGWSEPCQLPSVIASSELIEDSHVMTLEQAAVEASATALSSAEEVTQCHFAEPVVSPTWSVTAGGIWLHRSRPESSAIATPPTGTPGILINGTDFGFDWGSGMDFGIMHKGPRGFIWEGRYFNSDDAEATQRIPSVTTFRMAGIGITILGGGSINSTYSTSLDSTEFNLHKVVNDRLTFFSGFRAIELRDSLRSNIATNATFVRWTEENYLYGGQVGTNWALLDPQSPIRLNLSLKGGAYNNEMRNRFTSTIVSSDFEEDNEISFVGEGSLNATYFITTHIALRGGYQVLWLDNLALASDAAAATVQGPGGTSSPVISDGRLFYNGATAAVEFVW